MAWPSNHRRQMSLCLAAVLLCCVRLVGLAGAALGAPSNEVNKKRLDSTVRYLQDVQLPDGGFANPGQPPSQDFSAWVAFALAAAGINPRDQSQPGGVDAYTFLVEHFHQGIEEELCAPIACTTTLERELLVVDTSGTNPHDFAGVDLISEILARKLPDGSFPFVPGGHGQVNDTIYAILSLALINEPAAQQAMRPAVEWLIAQENSDLGWAWQGRGEPSEVDMTGAVIEALNAAGRHNTQAQQNALEYLHKAQASDGGFPKRPGEAESNVASTAWAVQGLWSAGENPENWVKGSGREPLGYMESLQQSDGSIQWKSSSHENTLWMTAMAAPTFTGGYFPFPEVPYVELPPSGPPSGEGGPTAPSSGSAEAGQGGDSSQPGGGVIAGGGGNGAALFSRPKPQSKGKIPGGSRQVHTVHTRATHKSAAERQRNPGARPKASAPLTVKATVPPAEPGLSHHGHGSGSTSKGLGAASRGAGSSTSTGEVKQARGPGSGSAAAGSGAGPTRTLHTPGSGGARSHGEEVEGTLIASPSSVNGQDALEPGAPGLHSAGAGGSETPWLAIAIAGLLALCFLLGIQFEHRRPQVIL
jgi:prenyltransferase beta subunit